MKSKSLYALALCSLITFSSFASVCESMLISFSDFSPETLYVCSDEDRREWCVGLNKFDETFAYMGDGANFIDNPEQFIVRRNEIIVKDKFFTPSHIMENASFTRNSRDEVSLVELDDGEGAAMNLKRYKRQNVVSSWDLRSSTDLHCSKVK